MRYILYVKSLNISHEINTYINVHK